jgi:hypothetical protein
LAVVPRLPAVVPRPHGCSFGTAWRSYPDRTRSRRATVPESGAHNRIRTDDLFLTKEVLYLLSYVSARPQRTRFVPTDRRRIRSPASLLERVAGIEPASSAWKAEVLPLNYTRGHDSAAPHFNHRARCCGASCLVVGEGFEPSKAKPSDLQSDPFDRSGTPPVRTTYTLDPTCAQPRRKRKLHHSPSASRSDEVPYYAISPCESNPQQRVPSHSSTYPSGRHPAPWCRHKELNPGPSHYK